MSTDQKLVGQAIRRVRIQRGLTQAQLAKAAGLSSAGNSVALIERGLRGVSLDTLESLAAALGVPSGCLLILGKRIPRQSSPLRDLLANTQKLVLKLVELQSVLRSEETSGSFKPARQKKRAAQRKTRSKNVSTTRGKVSGKKHAVRAVG
jgi:transcriptional regulator with XRE-family HTH domain